MKAKFFLVLIVIIISFDLQAFDKVDSLLKQLDKAIIDSDIYNREKVMKIEELKTRTEYTAPFSSDRYILNTSLIKEYKAYICDSTITYLNRNIAIADSLKDLDRKHESMIQLSYLMSSTGMYKESVDILDSIKFSDLPEDLLIAYYDAYDHAYGELSIYTQDKQSADRYRSISGQYKDSLYCILPENSELRLIFKENECRDSGRFQDALRINDIRLSREVFGSPAYALITFHRSLTYRNQGNIPQQKYYLGLSALSDIMSATKDHASLWMLAEILYKEGSIDRAYNYIRFSWEDTAFYNARLRSLQSAGILSFIEQTHQASMQKKNKQMQSYLILISILSVLLAVSLYYIYKQVKWLFRVRENLSQVNSQLKMLNEDLKGMNIQLQSTNLELSESNRIKEEYIGRFIKLCSLYISKTEDYRRFVRKKITGGKVDELLRSSQDQISIDEEIEEFYNYFDTAFLQIFPDFVEKFNELLQPNSPIILKKGEILNTELRIFALIRLGVNDSSQIAEFLRYSANTIYNYRAKVKNRAKVSRENFEELVKNIR